MCLKTLTEENDNSTWNVYYGIKIKVQILIYSCINVGQVPMNYLVHWTSAESQPCNGSTKIAALTQHSPEFRNYLRSRLIIADLRSSRTLTVMDPAVVGKVRHFEN